VAEEGFTLLVEQIPPMFTGGLIVYIGYITRAAADVEGLFKGGGKKPVKRE
jgi:hypothetical protein